MPIHTDAYLTLLSGFVYVVVADSLQWMKTLSNTYVTIEKYWKGREMETWFDLMEERNYL